VKIKQPTVALNLPKIIALLIVFGRRVVQAMTNNPWFPSPSPPLATVTADLDALEIAEAAVRNGAPDAAAERDTKLRAVKIDLLGLKAHVHGIALQHPDQGDEIILSASLSPKRVGRRTKDPLAARMGKAPQTVELRARSAGKFAAYEWQYSTDGGQTWIALATTTSASTLLPGVTLGTTYLFRVRSTRKNVASDWSQVVSLLAH
jgi:hypothetical protein